MNLEEILLVSAALLPAFSLCIYVYKKDRVEKESILLLLLLFVYGIFSCYPVMLIGPFVEKVIDKFFFIFSYTNEEGKHLLSEEVAYLYHFVKYTVGVALVEEGVKLYGLRALTRKDEEFNCFFDGLIYSVFVTLGFAAHENVLYVLHYGWLAAIQRAYLSVPGHMFFGVMMGYYYSLSNLYEKAGVIERKFLRRGLVKNEAFALNAKKARINSLLVPVLMHGIYDTCCTLPSFYSVIVFYAFVIFMYIICFRKINEMSQNDAYDYSYIYRLLMREYPLLKEEITEKIDCITEDKDDLIPAE